MMSRICSIFFLYAFEVFAEAHLYLKEWMSNSAALHSIIGLKVGSPKVKETRVLHLKLDIFNDLIKFTGQKFNKKVTNGKFYHL